MPRTAMGSDDPIPRSVRSGLKSSGSVRCVKHNYPDQRDKSEGHKRGQRHELLPVVGLWTEPPNLSVTVVTSLSQDQCFALLHRRPRRCHDYSPPLT
jgi:hypothetical protein